jgi:hypothetical protein
MPPRCAPAAAPNVRMVGDNQFHGSAIRPVRLGRQRELLRGRPAVKKRAGWPTPHHRLYGVASVFDSRNRTFAATEGYCSNTTRNEQRIWPSLRQRVGDFSNQSGAYRQTIYNPTAARRG